MSTIYSKAQLNNVGINELNPQGVLHVSQPYYFTGVTFTGNGVNDLVVNSAGFVGGGTTYYAIRIQNAGPIPNLIEISNDSGSTWDPPQPISNPIILNNGVTASFASTGGHSYGNQWNWTVGPSYYNTLVVKNGNVGIGTLTPIANLEVDGDAIINHITVGRGFGTDNGNNTVVGALAQASNTTGSNITAIGYQALFLNTTGIRNTALGAKALTSNSTGNYNTANGYEALYYNTSGSSNTANGYAALLNNMSGTRNSAIGYSGLRSNTSGDDNTATGAYALNDNTTGNNNTANGASSLYNNTSGYSNTACGFKALYSNSIGFGNTAIGDSALFKNTSGDENTAIGLRALYSNTTASGNTAFGVLALTDNTSGSENTAVGPALLNNTNGHDNTAIGYWALPYNTTGDYNTALGRSALFSHTTGSNNTGLGYDANLSTGTLNNATVIGSGATVDASNKIQIGNTAVTKIGGQVSWTTFSDGRYKQNIKDDVGGLNFINSLRPITYTVNINALDEYFSKNRIKDAHYETRKKERTNFEDKASKIVYSGFIAQEVQAAAAKLHYNFSGVDVPETLDGLYGLRYSEFVVPLVKAVQELSYKNEELKKEKDKEIRLLQKQIDELKDIISKFK